MKNAKELVFLDHNKDLVDKLEYKIRVNVFKGKLPIFANIKWS